MLYCSHCKYEYKYGISVCPDCGERLSQTPDIPTSLDTTQNYPGLDNFDSRESHQSVSDSSFPIEWIRLANLDTQQDAQMMVDALRQSDIRSIQQGESSSLGESGFSGSRLLGYGSVILVEKSSVIEADLIGQAILGDVWEKARLIDINE